MKPWDIYTYDFEQAGPHPAVIVSHPDRVARAPWINGLICTTQRANRPPNESEVRLNGAAGLDWETLCRCDVLWLVEKAKLSRKRGSVSRLRRRQIVDKINAAMGWKLVWPDAGGMSTSEIRHVSVDSSWDRDRWIEEVDRTIYPWAL